MAKTFLINAGALSGARIFLALSQVLVLPVLARFLDPVAFGDMALAMSIVVFAQILSDAGMGRSLIRQPKEDPAEWNSVFWLLAAVGLGLAVLVVTLAPFVAQALDRPRLLWMLLALSLLPPLSALSAVSVARMEKDGQFPQLAVIRTLAGVVGLVAVLGLALAGAGVWALVAQQLAIAVVQAAGSVWRSAFRPGAPRNFTPLGGHIRFSRDNIGVSLVFSLHRQAPALLISPILGTAALGLFSMAQRFLNLPRTALAGPVAQTVFVRIAKVQSDRQKVADIYTASCLMLVLAVFPPMATLAGSASSLFPLLLSDTWTISATIFTLAAVGIMVEIATSCIGVLLQALDRTTLRLRMILERTVLRTMMIAAAVPFGLEAAAASISVFSVLYLPRLFSYVRQVAPVSGRGLLRLLAPAGLMSALVWLAMALATPWFSGWQMLGLSAVGLVLTWAAIYVLQRKTIRSALSTLNG